MRPIPAATVAILVALGLSGCGTLGYEDTNAEVDRRAECADGSTRPGELVAPWCKREQAATWTSESESKPIDFTGKDDDD